MAADPAANAYADALYEAADEAGRLDAVRRDLGLFVNALAESTPLARALFNPAFPEKEFEIERKLALSDVQQTRDDMYRYPLRLCLQQAFRHHPYGNTIEAVETSLARATRDDAAAWHARQVRAQPWALVVGHVDPEDLHVVGGRPPRPVDQLQRLGRPSCGDQAVTEMERGLVRRRRAAHPCVVVDARAQQKAPRRSP